MAARRYRFQQPDIAADDTVVPDHSISAENRRISIDDGIIAEIRMPLAGLHRQAILIQIKAPRSDRHALIQLYMMAKHCGLADDDASAMVNAEIISDPCTRIDVDARLFMGILGHHPGNEGHFQLDQLMGNPVDADGIEARIA